MLEEMAQQAIFGRPERNRPPGALHVVAGDVHFEVGEAQPLAGQRRPHAPQNRLDPSHQLARGERLGDIIVGAGLEASDPVHLLAAPGHHDDRHIGRLGRAPQPAADLEPGNPLDHPVEQDDVGGMLGGEQQGLVPVGCVLDVEILALEVPLKQVGEGGIVLDQQQASLHHRSFPAIA